MQCKGGKGESVDWRVAKKPNGPAASSGSGGRTCVAALHTYPPIWHLPFFVRQNDGLIEAVGPLTFSDKF